MFIKLFKLKKPGPDKLSIIIEKLDILLELVEGLRKREGSIQSHVDMTCTLKSIERSLKKIRRV
jgi:hypothetical protein